MSNVSSHINPTDFIPFETAESLSTYNEVNLIKAGDEVLKVEETQIWITHSWYELGDDSISAAVLFSLFEMGV